jgi:hypothetical protein
MVTEVEGKAKFFARREFIRSLGGWPAAAQNGESDCEDKKDNNQNHRFYFNRINMDRRARRWLGADQAYLVIDPNPSVNGLINY